MPQTDSLGSVAVAVSSTTARLSKNEHSLVSTAAAVSSAFTWPYVITQPVPPLPWFDAPPPPS